MPSTPRESKHGLAISWTTVAAIVALAAAAVGDYLWLPSPRLQMPLAAIIAILALALIATGRLARSRRAEAALGEQAECLRGIVENVVDGIVTIDGRGIVETFNPAAERLFGYAADEIVGRNVSLLMPEPERREHDGYIEAYLRTGRGKILGIGPREVVGRRKDGSTFPMDLATSEMLLAGRRVFIGTVRDISRRKKAVAALRENEARLKAIVDNSPAIICLKDIEGRYLLINKKFEAVHGLTFEEVKGKSAHDIFPQEIAERIAAHDDDVARTGAVAVREQRFSTPVGDRIHMEVKFPVIPSEESTAVPIAVGLIATDITERTRAEAALQESETRLREAARLARLGYFTWNNVEGRYTHCSEEFAWIFGVSVDEYLSSDATVEQRGREWVHPDDRDRYLAAATKTMRQALPLDIEYRIVKQNGDVRHLHELRQHVLDAEGTVVRTIGTVQDISDRKRTEAALVESRTSLSHAQRLARLGHWIWDERGDRLTYFSDTLPEIFGVSKAEFPATIEAVDAFTHPADRVALRRLIDDVKVQCGPYEVEYRIVRPDGEARTVREIGEAISDTAGVLDRTVATIQDITRQKRVEAALRRSERSLANAQRIARVGNWDKNLNTGDLVWSDEMYRIFGMTPGSTEPTVEAFYDRVHPDDREWVRAAEEAALDGGGKISLDHRIVRSDGAIRVVHEDAEIAFDDAGKPARMSGTMQDVTEWKRAEEELRAAKNAAEAASRAKSEFLATMSHELRTPLNAILGFSEILRNELFGPLGNDKYRDYIRDVHDSGAHLLVIINDILDISKAEAGKLELDAGPVDIHSVVEATLRLVGPRASIDGVEITTDIPEGIGELYGDELKIKQILVNLLSNAVKFTEPPGKVSLAVKRYRNGRLAIAIRDSGIGMSPEDIDKALTPFGQVDSKLERRFEGTGLGLPLVKAFTVLHGGRLTLKSKVGVGTTVTVEFPAKRVIAVQSAAE